MKKFKMKNLFYFLIIIFLVAITSFEIYKYLDKNSSKRIPNSVTDEKNTNSSYYASLYGTWTVTKHIPSKIKTNLSDSIISLCIGQKFTIEENQISSIFATISDPIIKEGTITASDFSNEYNDTLKNLGIPDNEVKYVNITEKDKNNHSVTIFITNEEKVYALLSGALFQLERS